MRKNIKYLIVISVITFIFSLPLACGYVENPEINVFKNYPEGTPLLEIIKDIASKGSLNADEKYVLLKYHYLLEQNGLAEKWDGKKALQEWWKFVDEYPYYAPAWYILAGGFEGVGETPEEMFYAYSRYLELVPSGQIVGVPDSDGKVWRNFADKLEEYGYVKAAEFPRKVYEDKLYEKINDKADLYKIGFYEWRDKYIIPMYEQKDSVKGRIQTKLATLNAITGGKLFIAPILLLATVFVLAVFTWKAIKIEGKKKILAVVPGALLVVVIYSTDVYLAQAIILFTTNTLIAIAVTSMVFMAAVVLVVKTIRSRSSS